MAIINVNISGVVATTLRVLPKRSDKKAITRQLGAAAMQFWKSQAQGLRSSSRDYLAGLQHKEHGDVVRITLQGILPNMVENGWPGGDLRQWLLKGGKAKLGAKGMYNTVPFRHGISGKGRNVGRAMPKALRNPAKRLVETLSRPGMTHGTQGGQHVVYGRRLHPDVFRMSKQAKSILTETHRPWHSTSVYMGMIRQEKVYKSRAQSQYTTFRRISSAKSDARSWYHRGIRPRHFAKATQAHIEGIAASIIDSVVGS